MLFSKRRGGMVARWYFQQWIVRLGLAGISGLGLLVFCGMFYLTNLQSLQRQQAELRTVSFAQPAKEHTTQEDPATQLANQLASFYQYFPNRTEMSDQVENLFDAAKKYNLVLENGSYEVVRGNAHKLTRCEVQLPLKGSYVQTREFIARVLQEIPNAALSNISIQRQKIGDSIVEAQIRLTLYYREA